jgi:hypothetical protein
MFMQAGFAMVEAGLYFSRCAWSAQMRHENPRGLCKAGDGIVGFLNISVSGSQF